MNGDQLAYPWENQASSPDRGILARRLRYLVQASTTSCTKLSREVLGLELVPREGHSGTCGRAELALPGVMGLACPIAVPAVRQAAAGGGSAVLGGGHPAARLRSGALSSWGTGVWTHTDSIWVGTHSRQSALSEDSKRNKTALPTKGKKAQKSVFFFFFFSHEELGLVANQGKGGPFIFQRGSLRSGVL